MNVHIEKEGNIFIINVSGNIGFGDIDEFSSAITPLIEENFRPKFIFDLSEMPYINSATIGKFVDLFRKITQANGNVVFCNVRPFVKNILMITKLATVFEIKENRDDAITFLKNIKTGV